jgi:hypothetical protein
MTSHWWRRRSRAWGALLAVIRAGLLLGGVVRAVAYASGSVSGSLKMVGWCA